MDARFRRYSHCSAKLSTSDAERGSASIRRTCCSSTFGSRSFPRPARSSSSSSGMLLQRKNDKRRRQLDVGDAIDRAARHVRRGRGPDAAARWPDASTRNRNSGPISSFRSAISMPASTPSHRNAGAALGARPRPSLLVERQRRLQVFVGDRPSIRAARQRRDDALGAGCPPATRPSAGT